MLEFFKKLFGTKPAETTAPYKVEAPAAKSTPAPKKAANNSTVKKAITAKPRKPKSPKV